MGKAARAIILEGDNILLMHRNKYGSQYFTLVGGQVNNGETVEQALVREVFEETGLHVTESRLVFTEDHKGAYNEQYIFLCKVAPHGNVDIQQASEEAVMNMFEGNLHKPLWMHVKSFATTQFRTTQLQAAILEGIAKGFPTQPVAVSAGKSRRTLIDKLLRR